MSWRDRPYAGDDPQPRMKFALPPWTPVVKWLIIANSIAAVLTIVAQYRGWLVPEWLNADGYNAAWALGALDVRLTVGCGQIWRLITTQYLHGGAEHFVFNMLGLYFFGPPLERQFGPRTFFWFYTFCGVLGGLLYILMSALFFSGFGLLIGASGCVLGLLAGCAILFPRMYLFIVPIRVGAVLFVILYVLSIVWDNNMADAAHLGGMIGGAAWILAGRRFEGWSARRSAGAWERKQREIAAEQEAVDRILAKIHERGIGSLTRSEKRMLKRATDRQIERERAIDQRMRTR